jgi:hypothetical protein
MVTVTTMPNDAQDAEHAEHQRLHHVLGWLRTAKENLPAINDGLVPNDQIVEASRMIDRLHRAADRLRGRLADARRSPRAA